MRCVFLVQTWDGVEEDEDGLLEERPGAEGDEEDDDEGEEGVEVVPVLPVSQPDDGGADHHHHTAQGVSHHVEEHSLDVEILTNTRLCRAGLSYLTML